MSHIHVEQTDNDGYTVALASLAPSLPHPLHFLHAPLYGAWQEAAHKQVVYFRVTDDDTVIGTGMAIQYALPGGLHYLYCPYGPLLTTWSPAVMLALKTFFTPFQKRHKVIFVRFDTSMTLPKPAHQPSGRVAATASLQPRNEWVLDITPSSDSLLSAMNKTGRYHVNLAKRQQFTTRFMDPNEASFQLFYDLMQTTAERDAFHLLPKAYYQAGFATLSHENAFCAVAEKDGQTAAVALIVLYDNQAHYVFGASSNEYRKTAPAYLLLWECIMAAKARGMQSFNFGGITDDIKSTHLHGVTAFKQRFGGYTVAHSLPMDLPLKATHYKLFRLYKTLKRHK